MLRQSATSLARPTLRMSEPEFVRFAQGQVRAEWVAGEVVLKMPVARNHDEIQRLVASTLDVVVRRNRLGKVRGPEFTMRMTLPGRIVRRDPDVMFISNERLTRETPTYLEGPADFVAEITSPESEFSDFNEKFHEYQSVGVNEYWVINPLSKSIFQFTRSAAGEFEPRQVVGDWLVSAVVPKFAMQPGDLFADERPDVLAVIQKLGLHA